MLLKISRLSKFCKKYWIFKYSNKNFDNILRLILNKMEYNHVELTIWSFQVNLFDTIEHKRLVDGKKFSTVILDKTNSIKFMDSDIYDEIRFFEINIYCNNERFFNINSDNYGEYTSITMDKNIDEDKLLKLLDEIFF